MKKNVMFKKFEEFINEDFDRSEEIEGLNLVEKITTEDFMEAVKNGTIDNSYIYRLVDYQPKPDKWVYDTSEPHEVFRPVYVHHTTYLRGRGGGKFSYWKAENMPMTDVDIDWKGKKFSQSMFASPFIIYPSNFREIEDYYIKNGPYYLKYGKLKQKSEKVVKGNHIGFKALSVSSLIKHMNELELDDELDLNVLLSEDNEKQLGVSLKRFGRNYIGYDFAEVLVYEVVNSNAAIGSIEIENAATDKFGDFKKTSEL